MGEFDYGAARKAIFGSSLAPSCRLVLLVLVEHMPRCFPSVALVRQETGLSPRQVVRVIQDLERIGVVRVARRSGAGNVYEFPEDWTSRLGGGDPCHHGTSATMAPVTPCHGTSATMAPVPVPPWHPKQEVKQKVKQEGSRSRRSQAPTTRSKAPKERKPTHPGHAELVAHYFEAFEKRRGTKPIFAGAEGTAVTRLLDAVDGDVAKAKAIVSNALASWQGDSITIRQIASDPSKWLTAAPAKSGRVQQGLADGVKWKTLVGPPQPNDETNRFVPRRFGESDTEHEAKLNERRRKLASGEGR